MCSQTATYKVASVSLLVLFAACHPKINPGAPSIPVVEPPPPPISTIQVPVTIPLERLSQLADAAAPRSLHTDPYLHLIDGGPDSPHCGYGVGYDVQRAPIALTGNGKKLDATLRISYWLQGRKRVPCPGPLVTGSCGTNGEPPRRISTGFTTTLGINPDWSAAVQTSAKPVQPLDTCNISFLNIDVTGRIVDFFGGRLQEMANRLNAEASTSIDLAKRVRTAWFELQRPILVGGPPINVVAASKGKLTDEGIWLLVNPQSAGYFPFRATDSEVTFGAQLQAHPRLVIGPRPDSTSTVLPQAVEVPAGNAFFLALPIEVGYAPINQELRRALNLDNGGTSFPPTGSKRITVSDAELFAYGAQVVLRLDFRGSAVGRAYFTATPTFNSYVNTLTFPDLDYTLETTNELAQIIDWFKHEEFRDYLRGRLSFDLSGPVEAARRQVAQALNIDTPDLRLRGTLAGLTPLAVLADPKHGQFRVVVQAAGTLSLEVK